MTIYKQRFYAITNAILLLLAILPSSYIWVVPCIFTAIFLIYIYVEKSFTIIAFDFAILALLVYEFILGIFSYGYNNCAIAILNQYTFTVFYFILRLSVKTQNTQKFFLSILSTAFGIISVFCIASFEIFKNKVYSANFNELYDFKYLYRPFGELNNIWATLSLCFLGIVLLSFFYLNKESLKKWYVYLPVILILYCIIISFSRGVYISCGILILGMGGIVLFNSTLNKKQRLLIISCCMALIALLCIPNMKDVARTIKMTETVSQKRSLAGRINALSLLEPALKENPLLGMGTANYSLAVNKYVYEDDNNTFTSFAPNILMQLLIEKGIIGALLWLTVAIIFTITLLKNIKQNTNKQKVYFTLLFFSIFVVREFSFPSYFVVLNIQLLIVVFFALSINEIQDKSKTYSRQVNLKKSLILLMLSFFPAIFTYYIFDSDKNKYQNFLKAIELNKLELAETYLDNSRNIFPTWIYYSCLNWKKFQKTNNKDYLIIADNYIQKAIDANQNDPHLQHIRAIILYYKEERARSKHILASLVEEFPNNTLYRISLGNLFYIENNKESSIKQYTKAIEISPSIMEGSAWKQFEDMDPSSVEKINANIRLNIENNNDDDDPILLAKSGKLYYILGDIQSSKKNLLKSVNLLPNLGQPWFYLGKISKYEKNEAMTNEYIGKAKLCGIVEKHIRKEEKVKVPGGTANFYFDRYNQYSNYIIRFQIWYNAPWDYGLLEVTFLN